MTRRLALVLAGAFSASLLTVLLATPADAVCRPNCLDLNKHKHVRDLDRGDRGDHADRWEHGKHHHHGWAKHLLHKKHKHSGNGGHDEPPATPPPVTQPPATPPPVEPPPPPPGPPPCIGC